MYYLQRYERVKHSWNDIFLFAFCGSLGFPTTFNPDCTFNRLATIFIWFGGMILNIVYNVGLAWFIMSPIQEAQTMNVQQIIDKDFTLIGDQFTLQKLSQWQEVNV